MPTDGSSPFVFEEKEVIDPSLLFFYDLFGVFVSDADDMIYLCNDIFNYDIFYHFLFNNKSSNLLLRSSNFSKNNNNECKFENKLILKNQDKIVLKNYSNSFIMNCSDINLNNYYLNYYNNLNNLYIKKQYKFVDLQLNLLLKDSTNDLLVELNKLIIKK